MSKAAKTTPNVSGTPKQRQPLSTATREADELSEGQLDQATGGGFEIKDWGFGGGSEPHPTT